jgi:hypothetical protein
MGVSEDQVLACWHAALETGVAAGRLNRAGAQVPLWSRDLPLVLKQRRPAPLETQLGSTTPPPRI